MQSRSKYIIAGIVILLVAFVGWYLKTILLYLVVSIVLSLIGQPIARFFSKIRIKKFKLSPSLFSLMSLATLLLLIIALFSLFIPLLVEEARIISKIDPNQVVTTFREPLQNLEFSLQKYQISYGNGEPIEKFIASKLTSILGFQEVSGYAQQMLSFTTSIVAAFFSISFITFFLMKDEKAIYNIAIMLTPPKHISAIKEIMHDTKIILTRYFIGILFDMLFVATITAIGLSIFGVKNALLIGLFAGIMNVIPYIGPLLSLGFALLVGVSSSLELEFYSQLLPLMGIISIVFLVVQMLDALIFQPLVVSNTVKAHPLEIFLVILSAGTIAGISGMVVAIPVYTIVRIIAKEFLHNFKIVQKLTEDLEEATEDQQ